MGNDAAANSIIALAERPSEIGRLSEDAIRHLVDSFYKKVRADPELGPIFDRAIAGDWGPHLATMHDFWSSVILTSGRYKGNPVAVHLRVEGIEPQLFDRWLALFGEWSWDDLPALPPEVILLPAWFPLNVYDFACWARQTIVPLTIVGSHRPVRPLPFSLSELRIDVDPALQSARTLAPLIDPAVHTCGTVPAHGATELAHPEPGFWIVGAKSYGRAPTFLLATGHEQVRSVVATIAADHTAGAPRSPDEPRCAVG